jgi:hypothetical protein
VIEVIARKLELFVRDIYVEFLGVAVADCDDCFISLRTVWDEVFLFDLYAFSIPPNHQILDGLSFAIEEGHLMADRSGFILRDYFASSDDGATADAFSLELYDEFPQFSIKFFERDGENDLFKSICVFFRQDYLLSLWHEELQIDLFINA